jgi:exoribonuclease R
MREMSEPGAQTSPLDAAFAAARAELGIRTEFPADVVAEAGAAAKRVPTADAGRVDRTAVEFVTVDPPGSRDLDQALFFERTGDGYRLLYAIADVGFWVDRGGAVEREAWLRGVTFYAPDERESLYPPVLSQGAASLLPDQPCPAVIFGFELDARADIVSSTLERALVRSRAQLTYEQALEHVQGGGKLFAGKPWADSLMLLKEFGEKRKMRETERGGVSLPILDQHVEKAAAARLGYKLDYELPNAAEDWNAQVSLLTGHGAALRMLDGRVGLLRTMPAPEPAALESFRRAALALGFAWEEGMSYPDFIHSVDVTSPNATALLWQARRTNRGADYTAFDGEPPAEPNHSALAMPYAHVTAPLRRLADRYVIDLLITLASRGRPTPDEVATLAKLPPLMDEAEKKDGKLERRVVDVAEAWTLRGCEGNDYPAVVLGVRNGKVEVQVQDPAIRSEVQKPEGAPRLELGTAVQVRLVRADVQAGKLEFSLAEGAPAGGPAANASGDAARASADGAAPTSPAPAPGSSEETTGPG